MTHPLVDPKSGYYAVWAGLDTVEVIEKILTPEELRGWAKGNILKYRLRLGKKDDPIRELEKIATYEAYLKYLGEGH